MKKILTITTISLLTIFGLTSCERQRTVTFHLKNYSQDRKIILLRLTVDNNVIFKDKLMFTPDTNSYLTLTKNISVDKGIISASVGSQTISLAEQLTEATDQIIFVSYRFNAKDSLYDTIHADYQYVLPNQGHIDISLGQKNK